MEYKTKKNNNATVDIKLTFNTDDIAGSFQKAYQKASKTLKIPGFRPGKAPLNLIEKMLGDSVAEDAINILIQDTFAALYPKLEIPPIYPPRFSVESFDKKKSLVVTGVYETRPEVSLSKFKKIKIDSAKLKVVPADVEDSLKQIQEKMARTQLKEEEIAANGDLLEIEYAVTAEAGNEPAQKISYKLGDEKNPKGFDEKLSGMKKGEVREFDYTYADDYAAKNYAGKTFHYTVTLKDIYQINFPEINDDLAMEWSGMASLEDLKKSILEEMTQYHESILKNNDIQKIFEKIYEDSKFIIPETMLKEETDNVFNQFKRETKMDFTLEKYAEMLKKTVEEVRKSFEEIALKRIKSAVTKYKIAEEEKLELSAEDFDKALEKYAMEVNQTLDSVKKEIKKNRLESYFREKFLFDKVSDYLYDITDKKKSKELTIKEVAELANGVSA